VDVVPLLQNENFFFVISSQKFCQKNLAYVGKVMVLLHPLFLNWTIEKILKTEKEAFI